MNQGPQLPLWRAELRVRNESDVTELGTPSSADTSTAASDNETGEVTHFKLIVKSTFLEFVQVPWAERRDETKRFGSKPRDRCEKPRAHVKGRRLPPDAVQERASVARRSLSDAVRGLFVACLGRLQALYWKSGGCHNGTQCLHCHLCPQGELQRRKKLHKILAKGRSTERRGLSVGRGGLGGKKEGMGSLQLQGGEMRCRSQMASCLRRVVANK
ncbi:unnamed protein product [Durusdinium trenchii]|uniref:C3H1-type domain-containing protein n=1 Tax=Durusdinium trenchii TaxID=1381693 RepID=A0ABP0PJR8_9DINO